MENPKEKTNKEKKKIKNAIKMVLLKISLLILVVVVIATSVLTIFTAIRDKMIELASSIKTAVTGFWKWVKDDYWIKLDEKIEYEETDSETRNNYYSK
jgi:hypothetical protein